MNYLQSISCFFLSLGLSACSTTNSDVEMNSVQVPSLPLQVSQQQRTAFMQGVGAQYNLTQADVNNALNQAQLQPSIIDKMTKPAEGKHYGDYRKLLITPQRISRGKSFMMTYAPAFAEAKAAYGVPPQMISSILGVETFYGKTTGKYRVLDSLSTLAFDYPKRAAYFQKELAQYIYLNKRNGWNIGNLKGSYAGAFGLPQFMPSAYLNFAVSANPSDEPNLYNPNDAIMSIGHYFKENGWRPGAPVAMRVQISPMTCSTITCNKRRQLYSLAELRRCGVKLPRGLPANEKAGIITVHMDDGNESWLVFHNFYVIMTYNISINYAMAAFELSNALRK